MSGAYLRITAEYVGVGVGAHRFDRDRLARFVDWCVRRWERQLPLHRWLADELG